MPRPKRARRAPASAAAAAAAPDNNNNKSSPAPASSSDIYSHSDREHSVIRKELDKGDETRVRSLRRSTSLRQRQALEDAGRARDQALSRLKDEIGTTSSLSSNEGKKADERQKSDSSMEVGRKTRATPVQQRRDTTGLDLDDDDMFEGLDTTIAGDTDDAAAPRSAARSDVSTFSVSHFRRRGRAPSISINKDDAPIRPSSRGISTPGISSTFNIGQFRRRQREPSILGTAEKERAQRPVEPSSEPESGEEGDDFEPEAESTPLTRRKSKPAPATQPDSISDSQQVLAPDSQPERDAEATSSIKSRKRKSIESQDDSDRPGKAPRTEPDLVDDHSDSELSDLPSPLLTPTRPSAIPRPVTPNQDDIMAPPQSSSSEDGDEAWPDIRTLAKQRRRRASPATPTRDGNMSDASSPPSLTHSPNFPATRNSNKSRRKKQPKSPKITTADLTGLLPRRRHKKNQDPLSLEDSEEEELNTSDLAQDDDELSHADARTRSRRAKTTTTPLNRSSANRSASSRSAKAASAAKAKATPGSSRRSTRTYSRRLSDKENGDDVEGEGVDQGGEEEEEGDSFAPAQDEAIDGEESIVSILNAEELKQAARKFKEVDRWELEFEEVTQSSSPNRDGR